MQSILDSYFLKNEVKNIFKIEDGLTNINYKIELLGGYTRFLKVYRYTNYLLINNEIEIIEHLLNNKYPTPKIIATRNGVKLHVDPKNTAVMMEFINGKYPKQTEDNLLDIGKLIATLHCIDEPKNLKDGYALQFRDIVYSLKELSDKTYKYSDVIEFFKLALNKVENIPFNSLPKGLVHCDVFLDNMIMVTDTRQYKSNIYLIDFEEVAKENFLFDIARCVFGCCIINGNIDYILIRSLIKGYESVRKLTSFEVEYLYEYIIYCGILSTFWRFYEFNIKRPGENKEMIYKEFVPPVNNLMSLGKDKVLNIILPM